jgi:hypothetical protein
MLELTLTRTHERSTVTLGILKLPDESILYTLELPWKDNKHDVSCIPKGSYVCRLTPTKNHGMTYAVTGVPNRVGVLIHPGNTVRDTLGCILVGLEQGAYPMSSECVMKSRLAMSKLKKSLNYKTEFLLRII